MSKTVVVTGCFQLLHYGHLALLGKAREYGKITLLLNTDKGTKELKKYLAQPYKEREKALLSTGLVDQVIPFHTNPAGKIKEIRPDFWIAGSDHTKEKIMEQGGEYAGEVVILPYTEGISSTTLHYGLPPASLIDVVLKPRNAYLEVHVVDAIQRLIIRTTCYAVDSDLRVSLWINDLPDELEVSEEEYKALSDGKSLARKLDWYILRPWVTLQKQSRIIREGTLKGLESLLEKLSKLDDKEDEALSGRKERVSSDIIPSMDGSVDLWIRVLASAQRDFLRGYRDPERAEEWDMIAQEDLLDENGEVKRGQEEAWNFVTARDFLLDDDYYISFDSPEAMENGTGKEINCRDLIEWLIEVGAGPSILDPSIEHLRARIAKASGDPQLISIYCKD